MFRLLAFLIFLLSAPVLFAQDATQPSGTITLEESASDDAAMATRIRDIIGELDGYEDVTVQVSSGIVTLRGTTEEAADIARLNELVGRVEGIVAIENEVVETTDIVRRLNPAVERFRARMGQVVAFVPLALVAAVAFAIVSFGGFALARMKQPWDRLAPNSFIADIFRQLLRIAFIIAGIVIALDIMGATALLSTILGAAGIIGLAIGFAVRDTVENFIASVMLSIRQPFRPNDTIEIGGDTGKVIRLTSRATILLSFDGNHIRIPNATVFKSRIVNYSRNRERRFVFGVGVAYGTDLSRARQIAHDTLKSLPFVLEEPECGVWIDTLGDSVVNLRLAAWIDQHETDISLAKSEAMRIVLAKLGEAGIEMPEPTFRVITDMDAGGAKASVRKPATRKPARRTTKKLVVEDVDARADDALKRIIDEERKDLAGGDLLNRDAPEE